MMLNKDLDESILDKARIAYNAVRKADDEELELIKQFDAVKGPMSVAFSDASDLLTSIVRNIKSGKYNNVLEEVSSNNHKIDMLIHMLEKLREMVFEDEEDDSKEDEETDTRKRINTMRMRRRSRL